jgi:hypothetical protein
MNTDTTRIVQYVSKRKDKLTHKYVGPRIGVIVAQVRPENPTQVGIGWAKAKVGDAFDKEMGLQIATNRAALLSGVGMAGKRKESKVPDSFLEEVMVVYNRAVRYFKDKEVILPFPYQALPEHTD